MKFPGCRPLIVTVWQRCRWGGEEGMFSVLWEKWVPCKQVFWPPSLLSVLHLSGHLGLVNVCSLLPGVSGKKRDPLLCFCIKSQPLVSSELSTPDLSWMLSSKYLSLCSVMAVRELFCHVQCREMLWKWGSRGKRHVRCVHAAWGLTRLMRSSIGVLHRHSLGHKVSSSSIFAVIKAPEHVCNRKQKENVFSWAIIYPCLCAYESFFLHLDGWDAELFFFFVRRYLTCILRTDSNWHDKRVTASGWHSSHPSCHWKRNAFAMCLFLRHQCAEPVLQTPQQGSCVFAFGFGASSVAWEAGLSTSNELIFFTRVWHELHGNRGILVEHPQVWKDEQQSI